CTWTILASGVSDLDGAADALAADVTVMFTTLDPGSIPAPTVISTLPADGASHVPLASDVRVNFSEIVTTTPGAFALSCNATPINLTETGSGNTRTLTPATVLPASASCEFTIDAAHVRNASDIAMEQSLVIHFTVSDGSTSGYYSSVNTSSPGQLRCSLHLLIRGHTAYPYSGSGTNTWTILETAQAVPGNPGKILDVYKNRLYNAVSDRAGTGGGVTYNREHTWPNSLGFPSTTGNLGLPNAPYTDTHMLWLSDTGYNSDRGNKPYANCASGCGERVTEVNGGVGGGSGTYPGNSNWVNSNSFETWNHRKGEMARAIFYMAIRYEGGTDPTSGQTEPNLELTDNRSLIVGTSNYNAPAYMGLLSDLLAWSAGDPPDAEEVARNDAIQIFQGNRNPFVDHPEWVSAALFQSSNPATCEPLGNDVIFVDGFEAAASPTVH
ncbi:MAG: endonuclease, partial [Dokdonella sp.]